MFDIDALLEAVQEDPQEMRRLYKFARENPVPQDPNKREAYKQAMKDATKGASRDARDTKRVSDYAKVGGTITGLDIANKIIDKEEAYRGIANAALYIERALNLQDSKGNHISEANVKSHLDKALAGMKAAIADARKVGALNSSQIGVLSEFTKDCKEQLDVADEVERNSYARELIGTLRRWKVDIYDGRTKSPKMVSIADFVSKSKIPTPLNTPTGPEKQAWLANSHANNGIDKRDAKLKQSDKEMEDASYKKIKEIGDAAQRHKESINKGETPEGTSLKSFMEKELKDKKANGEKVTNKHVNNIQALATKEKLNELHIPTMKERPVEGCDNVKKLVEKWSKEHKNGVIEIAYRPAKQASGAGTNEVQTKPIVYIAGNYYQVPQNDLFTKAKGGIAVADSPYLQFVKKAYKEPKHAELRAKLKLQSTVETEDEPEEVSESVKNYFKY